jgi:hypothetical protein
LPTVQPIAAGARNLLVVSAAAVLLLVGLLSLPSSLRSTTAQGMEPVATTGTSSAEKLLVTNMLRLPGGLAFEMTDTPTGTETIVTAVPEGMGNTVAAGDVLLVYSPSGETLGTGTALRDILTREFEKGVTTYSFVIRRGASTMDAEFRLEVAG